jgi:hypothetical protein
MKHLHHLNPEYFLRGLLKGKIPYLAAHDSEVIVIFPVKIKVLWTKWPMLMAQIEKNIPLYAASQNLEMCECVRILDL